MSNIKIPKLNISGKSKNRTPGNRSVRSVRSNMQSNRSVMSESRREKLLSIQKREKLKALLVKKFRMQYGTSKAMESVILKAIDGFVRKPRVTEQDLDNLGKQIASAAKLLGKPLLSGSRSQPNFGKSNNNNMSSSRRSNNMSSSRRSNNSNNMSSSRRSVPNGPNITTTSASVSTPSLKISPSRQLAPLNLKPKTPAQPEKVEEVPEDWSLIFRYQQKKQAEEAIHERLIKKEEREATLSSLESLTAAKQKRRQNASKLDIDYSASVQANMKKWKLEEDQKRIAHAAAIKKQSVVRKAQMEDRKRRAAQEKQQKLKYERNLMRRLNRETKQQEDAAKKKLKDDKSRLIEFLAGNAAVRKRKDDIVAKEREEDVQRMKDYAAILKKQEDARKEFFEGRAAKMDKNASKNVEARKDEFEATRARELRDLRFQKEKDDAIVEEQRKKAEWRRKNQQDINVWLNDTIRTKQQEREKEKSMYIEINNYAKTKAAQVSLFFFSFFLILSDNNNNNKVLTLFFSFSFSFSLSLSLSLSLSYFPS